MGDSIISSLAISRFNKGMNPAIFWVYFGVIWMMFMSWCSAGYVAVKTVDSSISFTNGLEGYYADYGKWSSITDQLGLMEVIALSLFLFWSLMTVVLSTTAGALQWSALDERVAYANTTVFNAHTPLRWDTGIMHFFLSVLTGMAAMITGGSLGEVVVKMVGWFDQETDNIKSEAYKDYSASTTERVANGVSFQNDLLYHLIAVFYGWFVLSVISLGGFIFMIIYTPLDDDFDCEFEDGIDFNSYAGAFPFITSMTSYDDCMTKIDQVFPFFDDNKDGFISRCEDAQFQYTMGETREFAIKFSSPFTKESFRKICEKRFPYI